METTLWRYAFICAYISHYESPVIPPSLTLFHHKRSKEENYWCKDRFLIGKVDCVALLSFFYRINYPCSIQKEYFLTMAN